MTQNYEYYFIDNYRNKINLNLKSYGYEMLEKVYCAHISALESETAVKIDEMCWLYFFPRDKMVVGKIYYIDLDAKTSEGFDLFGEIIGKNDGKINREICKKYGKLNADDFHAEMRKIEMKSNENRREHGELELRELEREENANELFKLRFDVKREEIGKNNFDYLFFDRYSNGLPLMPDHLGHKQPVAFINSNSPDNIHWMFEIKPYDSEHNKKVNKYTKEHSVGMIKYVRRYTMKKN
jgi:hypothetical protein